MSDSTETVSTPVSLDLTVEGQATLTFGPMPIADLGEVLRFLGTTEGYLSFMESLDAGVGQKAAEMKRERNLQQE